MASLARAGEQNRRGKRKSQTSQSLMGYGRGFGFSPTSGGKALKVQSWGDDMHSLVLMKSPLLTDAQMTRLAWGVGSEGPGEATAEARNRQLERGRGNGRHRRERSGSTQDIFIRYNGQVLA